MLEGQLPSANPISVASWHPPLALLKGYFVILCIGVLTGHFWALCGRCMQCAWSPEEGAVSIGLSSGCWVWEPGSFGGTLSPVEEQALLAT